VPPRQVVEEEYAKLMVSDPTENAQPRGPPSEESIPRPGGGSRYPARGRGLPCAARRRGGANRVAVQLAPEAAHDRAAGLAGRRLPGPACGAGWRMALGWASAQTLPAHARRAVGVAFLPRLEDAREADHLPTVPQIPALVPELHQGRPLPRPADPRAWTRSGTTAMTQGSAVLVVAWRVSRHHRRWRGSGAARPAEGFPPTLWRNTAETASRPPSV
jgi:hypothetical protein